MSTANGSPTVFEIADLDELGAELSKLAMCIESEDVALVRGLVSTEFVREVLGRIANTFTTAADSTVDVKSHVRDPRDIPNYQRLMLGEFGDGQKNRSFCMRMFYNPMWAADLYGMRETFRKLTILRNLIYGVDESFCLDVPEDGVYTLSRIHQYPRGGGFLNPHRDEIAAGVPASAGLRGYTQVLLVMNEKGTDFTSGGGYYMQGENRVLYEEFTAPGDILIYNGRTTHGVQTIDPHVLPELGLPGGRYSATVTLYRVPQR